MAARRLNLWNSVLGWSSILLAGAIYAVLTLSPRMVLLDSLSGEHTTSRERLKLLDEQTRQMQHAVDSLESNPSLMEELARAEWRLVTQSEETIGVDPSLQAGLARLSSPPRIEAVPSRPSVVWLTAVSRDESLRGKLMLAAVALSLIAIISAPRDKRCPAE